MTKQDEEAAQEQNIQTLQEKIASLNEQIRWYNSSLAEFVHDTRAPTGMVVGALELLKNECREGLTDTQKQMIDIAWRGVQRLIEGQDFYLALLRFMYSQDYEPQLSKVDINSVIREYQSTIVQFADASPPVLCDYELVSQALGSFVKVLGSRNGKKVDCQTTFNNDRVSVKLIGLDSDFPRYREDEANRNIEDKLNQKRYYAITFWDIGKALVEKQGGQAAIEKLGESGVVITFTLPVYKEKTPPST
jgi:light-regulated signal transduction histidine kinase (bacteriophytochrome)